MTDERNQALYGCDPVIMQQQLAEPLAQQGLSLVLMSMLSDAQEMVAGGWKEEARRHLNRVKLLISTKLPVRHTTPADVSVDVELAHLRELLLRTSGGKWHCLPGRALAISGKVSAHGYQGFDVLRGHGNTAKEAKANAELGAKLRNAAEALLDAAELAQHVLNQQDKLPRNQRDPCIVDQAQATLAKLKAALA